MPVELHDGSQLSHFEFLYFVDGLIHLGFDSVDKTPDLVVVHLMRDFVVESVELRLVAVELLLCHLGLLAESLWVVRMQLAIHIPLDEAV